MTYQLVGPVLSWGHTDGQHSLYDFDAVATCIATYHALWKKHALHFSDLAEPYCTYIYRFVAVETFTIPVVILVAPPLQRGPHVRPRP